MDLLSSHEIYVPADAEVKSILLRSLPKSVLTRMGLPLSDSGGSRNLPDSPEGIWISPVVLRLKGQKQASKPENGVVESVSSKVAREFQASSGPLRMSFAVSNQTAHKVLKDTCSGQNDTSSTSAVPRGSVPQIKQDAVIIYQGRIYLSIRRSKHNKGQKEKCDPAPSDTSSHSQKKLPNANRSKRNQPQTKETQSKYRKVTLNRGENSLSQTVPQSSIRAQRVDSQRQSHVNAEQRQTAEQAAVSFQDEINTENGVQELGEEEAGSISQGNNMHSYLQMNSSDHGSISSQSWTRREPQGASSTSLLQDCDYRELEFDEKIAQMNAKLRQQEALMKHQSH
ncbi:uncharacterized protein si:dkeyp-110g5.4 [Xyrichtys novacula]|uniref:Uncharacterized protein si:dkeyp-110g5.4 n=1 Tax=Xyrichtys novacula TaxID=13765 RepID=A0AAV1F2W0_XYRNO|nr:uncharacterized protein si:dkeyp-110g5.4 [Xyrichtys novacula]